MVRDRYRHRPNYRYHYRPDHRPPEPPHGWHEQDWLLILEALEYYALDGQLTQGQELRAYQLLEGLARFHGTVSLGAIQRLDVGYFEQYARHE